MTTNIKRTVGSLTVAAAALGSIGLLGAGTASAEGASDTNVRFSPTISFVPNACGAVIDATEIAVEQGEFAVKVAINRAGPDCGAFQLYINWRNLDTGLINGEAATVNADGTIVGAPDNVISGFGMAPGVGRVSATIETGKAPGYPQREPLPNIAGRATFTLR